MGYPYIFVMVNYVDRMDIIGNPGDDGFHCRCTGAAVQGYNLGVVHTVDHGYFAKRLMHFVQMELSLVKMWRKTNHDLQDADGI